jgi:hypothetical protein
MWIIMWRLRVVGADIFSCLLLGQQYHGVGHGISPIGFFLNSYSTLKNLIQLFLNILNLIL